jgi:hypothetical protein
MRESFSAGLVYQSTGRWNARGDAIYVTMLPFTFIVGEPGSTMIVDIPAGFETDLASIPRLLRWWLDRDGPWVQAAVVHDWLYSGAYLPRLIADYALWLGMGVAVAGVPRVGRLDRAVIYAGVRLGGWRPYRRYLRAKRR